MDKKRNKLQYLTIFQKDYVQKPIERIPTRFTKYWRRQQFKDPIAEGFNSYLLLQETDGLPPNENAGSYLVRLKEMKAKIGSMYFKEPLDENAIKNNNVITTEYRTIYCQSEKELSEKKSNNIIRLSDDAIIPLSSYNMHFRLPPKSCIKVPYRHLKGPKGQIKGGGDLIVEPISEYNGRIGKLGHLIVEANSKKHSCA